MTIPPSTQISTNSMSVSDVLKASFFEIPANQREYRWGQDQLEKFWDDLTQTIERDSISDPTRPMGHFLGAIVVIGQEQSLDNKRLQVIDGQQRLTTVTILAECLRPYVEEIKDRKIRKKLEHVLWDCVVSPANNAPRLRLNREDEYYRKSLIDFETFKEKVMYWETNTNPKSEVQKNIKYAFLFFNDHIIEYLDAKSVDDREDAIRELSETLTEMFYLLLVRTEHIRMAYKLFETLNERGLDLSQADLIRNILLESAQIEGKHVFDKVTNLWSTITDNYENQSVKKLELPQIIQFSYSYRQGVVKKEQIFDQISSDLRNNRCDASELANEFYRDSLNWCSFLLGDMANWSDELADIQYAIVDPLWKSHCAPFVMAAMDVYSRNINELEICLRLCEHFLFRQGLVCKESVSFLQNHFGEAAAQIRSGQTLERLVEFFSDASPDYNFVDNFKLYSVKNMKQGFYVLWKIESYLAQKVGFKPKNQSAAQHLEHIMPRNPGSDWKNIEKCHRQPQTVLELAV